MTTIEEARDQLIGAFRLEWLSSAAAAFPLEYDDVRADADASPTPAVRRTPFGRLTVRSLGGQQETQGQLDARRFLNTCALVLQIFTEPGDGRKKADQLTVIALRIMRQLRDPNGVWSIGDASSSELGLDGALQQTNVVATFNYEERA